MKEVRTKKRRGYQSGPLEAWARSCSVALPIPLFVGLFIGLIGWLVGSSDLTICAVLGVVGMLVHFAAYMILGLPVFCVMWDNNTGELWTGIGGYVFGGGLGFLALLIFGSPIFALIGLFYGGVTAYAAQRARREVRDECLG